MNSMTMDEPVDDALFAPINDIDSIFEDEPIVSNKVLSSSKMPGSIEPTPIQYMIQSNMFQMDGQQLQQRHHQNHHYQGLRGQIAVPEVASSLERTPKPSTFLQNDFLLSALDEMEEITSDYPPHEVDTFTELKDHSFAARANLEPLPIMSPKVARPPSFGHLRPSLPARRIVSDECGYSSFKALKPLEPIKRSKSSEGDAKFRVYQTEKWHDKFKELLDYKQIHGHCQVPHGYGPSPTLARWCKRQRYQYKLFLEEKPSTITLDRVQALEKIGFVWDSHTMLWNDRLQELQDYIATFGHANVPSTYPANQKLAIWVKCQRRQYKLLLAGQPSNMTHERVDELNELGFVWEVRKTA